MRLTKKNNGQGSWTQFGDKYLPAHNIRHKQCVNKLGQLEDIEQGLGIDLITLFKGMKEGVYCIECEDKVNLELVYSDFFGCFIFEDYIPHFHRLTDYGKTWALTKEELENGTKL